MIKIKCKKFHIKSNGQSTIEFIFSFSFLLFFFLFFITTATNIGVGYLVHYATFKASRTYLSYDNGGDRFAVLAAAEDEGRKVFDQFNLKAYGIKDGSLSFNNPSDDDFIYEYVGAYYYFRPPFARLGTFQFDLETHFLSESFLGKEPSVGECECRVQEALGFNCEGEANADITLYDNGC